MANGWTADDSRKLIEAFEMIREVQEQYRRQDMAKAQKKYAETLPAFDGYEETTRPCAHCGQALAYSFPYAYCHDCQEQQRCVHGTLYKEDCSGCNTASDVAYDAWRERRWR